MDSAVDQVMQGSLCTEVSHATSVPYSTLTAHVRAKTKAYTIRGMGRPPHLSLDCEKDIVDWVIAMQMEGLPIKRKDIMVKASQVAFKIHPQMTIEYGWYKGFRRRHPILSDRHAQTISRASNAVDDTAVSAPFSLLENQIETHELTPDRIWNMDETAFQSRKKSGKVVAVKGTRNVWLQTLDASYHLSIAACVSAA
ncbi:unnamed protein product, partial [Aphanomyces euteiches]